MSQLRVMSVAVQDVLGIKEVSLEPGSVTVIRGKNGSSKSSLLAAVQTALGGGSLAKIARIDPSGAPTEPEVVLVLEGEGYEHYRVERNGEKVRVRSRVGNSAALEDVAKPQAFLSSLFDAGCANPVRFLTAPDKERALLLLEALPLSFSRERLLEDMGITAEELKVMGAIPAGLHPLEEIAMIRESVFRTRTGVNRDQQQQFASAEQLKRSIPADMPRDLSATIHRLETSLDELKALAAKEEADVTHAEGIAVTTARNAYDRDAQLLGSDFKVTAAKARREHEVLAASIRADAEQRIAELLAETERAIATAKDEAERAISAADERRDLAFRTAADIATSARTANALRVEEVITRSAELARLRAEHQENTRADALREQVDLFEASSNRLHGEAKRLTDALTALDAHRRRLADNLPIPGLEIEGKAIRVNGVPYEQLNTAQRVAIAVKVSTLRAQAQRLPVVFVDGAEALDTEHFEFLVSALEGAGCQAFIGRVDDGALTVQTRGSEVSA